MSNNDSNFSKNGKELINLNPDNFYGRTNHKDIFQKLLEEIQPINCREFLGMPDGKKLMQKHIIVAVVKHLLQTAKNKNWNLCKVYDYAYIYNGAYWQQCSKEDMRQFLSSAAIKMGMPDYEASHYEFANKLLLQFLSDAHLPTPESYANKVFINLHNGTFEFADSYYKLREFNPNDFLTYQLPFDYDETASCPMFNKYLLEVLPDASSRMILQEFAGYIFTPLHLEKILVLYGSGRNGKSVFFNVLQALIGVENILTYSLGLFNHEYNRAKLSNVLLNYSSEKGTDLNVETFKALISGEPQQAREPYGKSYTFRHKVRFIMNANELPKETEQTNAYFERYEIVPFDTYIKPEDRDSELANKIIEKELPGVFNWLLTGLNRILLQKKFSYSEKAEIALKEFRKQSDSVQLFVEENNYKPSTENKKEALTDLYILYKSFCTDDGYKAVGKNKFSKRLENKGFEKTRLNNGASAFFIDKKDAPF